MFKGLPEKLVNMGPSDRLIRFLVGSALTYFGLITQTLTDSTLINLLAGSFGLTNLISALFKICPGYLLMKFSTLPRSVHGSGKNRSENTAVADQSLPAVAVSAAENDFSYRSISLKLMASIVVPVLAVLAVFSYLMFDLTHELNMSRDSTMARAVAEISLKLSHQQNYSTIADSRYDSALLENMSADLIAVVFHDEDGRQLDSPIQKLPEDPLLLTKMLSNPKLLTGHSESMLMFGGKHLIRTTTSTDSGMLVTTLSHNSDHAMNTRMSLISRLAFICLLTIWIGGWGAYYIVKQFTRNVEENASALKHRSTHDVLTGLRNRAGLDEVIGRRIQSSDHDSSNFALLLIDLANFRYFNDTLGHKFGDELLRLIADRLRGVMVNGEDIVRISSDVFCVISAPGHDRTFASRLANTVHDAIEDQPTIIRDIQLDLRCHIGLSFYPQQSTEGHELVRLADIALDQAKKGRSRTVFYQAENDPHSVRKLSLLAGLRTAIDENQLHLVYQPKMDVSSGALHGVEALVRWSHPIYNQVSPFEFIGWAEKSGLIDKLTHWVLNEAEQQCGRWSEMGYQIPIAVNLSPVNLQDKSLPALVKSLVTDGSFSGGLLELELTENAVMEDPASALEIMNQFCELGVPMAIDDFGTGLASFGYLRKFPVSNLKIDRMFVNNSESDDRDEVLLSSMIDLGHNLNCVVTAEGVEEQGSLDLLKQFGCDYAQGYLLCKPISADDIISWIEADSIQVGTEQSFSILRDAA